jgi:hypothetical protein
MGMINKENDAKTGVIVVRQSEDGKVLEKSLPTQDIGIANNLRAIVGMERSYLVITGEDDSHH